MSVGENKRYGSDLTQSAINDALLRPRPISLSEREVGKEITNAEAPVPVEAWVRFPESAGADEGHGRRLDQARRLGRVHDARRLDHPRVGVGVGGGSAVKPPAHHCDTRWC
jgi:hypothetical protein